MYQETISHFTLIARYCQTSSFHINGIPIIGLLTKQSLLLEFHKSAPVCIQSVYLEFQKSSSGIFLEFQLLEPFLQIEIVQILGWLLESKTIICVHFSPLFFPSFSSLSLYEYNSKLILGKVGFAVLCFLLFNGMDGLFSLCTLCRYYYYCNTNTTRSFRVIHSFSISTIDYSTYFRVCKVFIASKCCILIIIIEFDCI